MLIGFKEIEMDKSQDVCTVCDGGPGNDSICSCPPDYRFPGPVSGRKYKKMTAIERLKHTMFRVEKLVNFYLQSPTVTLDMMDSITDVTMRDLNTLLDGLKDRDISLSEMPELTGLGRIHKETIKARSMSSAVTEIFKRPEFKTQKEIYKENIEGKAWTRGYNHGYTAGRNGELKRIETLINNYIRGIPND